MPEPKFKQLLDEAVEALSAITGFPSSSITSVKKTDQGWEVVVELLEKKGIPDRMDILGEYLMQLDTKGDMQGYERTSLRKRGDTGEQVSEE